MGKHLWSICVFLNYSLDNTPQIDCPVGGTVHPDNGTASCTKSNKPTSVCHYSCVNGYYVKDGPDKISCTSSGKWSPPSYPRCSSKLNMICTVMIIIFISTLSSLRVKIFGPNFSKIVKNKFKSVFIKTATFTKHMRQWLDLSFSSFFDFVITTLL